MDLNKIGKLIAKKRKEKGYTQESLGAELGVSDKTVSKWERGVNAPDISLLVDISRLLGVSVNNLLLGIDKESKEETHNEDKSFIANMNYYFKNYKKNIKKKMYLIIIFIILIFSILFVINNYDKCQLYSIINEDNEIDISGYVYFNQRESIVDINSLRLLNYRESDIEVKMLSIDLLSKDERIEQMQFTEKEDIKLYLNSKLEKIRINTKITEKTNENIFDKSEVSNLKIIIKFIDINNKKTIIEQQIKLKKEFTNNRIFY